MANAVGAGAHQASEERGFLRSESVLARTLRRWDRHSAPSLSAAMAFYAMISLAPVIALSVAIAGGVLGRETVRGEVARRVTALLDPRAAEVVLDLLRGGWFSGSSALGGTAAVLVLVYGSTAGFAHLRGALNRIFAVPSQGERLVLGMLKTRLVSFALVLGVGAALVVLISLQTFAESVLGALLRVPAVDVLLLRFGQPALSLAVLTVLFTLLLEVLPAQSVPWRAAWIGGGATALLFLAGQLVIGFYLGRVSLTSAFGAAGSLMVLMLWVYYSCMIFLLGAALTAELSGAPAVAGPPPDA